MRYLVSLGIALVLTFGALWAGSWVADVVTQPNRQYDGFTVGRKLDLCGYAVDLRHEGGGYDLEEWQGERCDTLSELDHCLLACLADAGTVQIGAACYDDCLAR